MISYSTNMMGPVQLVRKFIGIELDPDYFAIAEKRITKAKGEQGMSDMKLMQGDCLDKLKELDDNSVDSIVTDPPYGLSFMGKAWDHSVPSSDVWREALRVLKPGGHLLAFAGTRTQHRMAVAIEDAGFEIRDMIAWVYGSGFPKSHNVSKAIDKMAGAEREVLSQRKLQGKARVMKGGNYNGGYDKEETDQYDITAPATPEAQQWDGWGTALKPALEPITVARKPLAKGNTVAANVLAHGTGALNIDGCRVETDELAGKVYNNKGDALTWGGTYGKGVAHGNTQGRWPANLIHDGSDEVVGLFPVTTSGKMKQHIEGGDFNVYGKQYPRDVETIGDTGSAARFFYCAKANKRDRNEGCEGLELRQPVDGADKWTEQDRRKGEGVTRQPSRNHHPTVKPTDLMRYLVRLVTPPGGVVLDPFMGSGSTGKAARLEGFRFIGIELDPEYFAIAEKRINDEPKEEQGWIA